MAGTPSPRQFVIFGYNIQYTLSPTIHNAAFAALGLPHHYSIHDVPSLEPDETRALLSAPSFGGASVTLPHKLAIIPFLDQVSDAASMIGAVNTIIVDDSDSSKRVLKGDNTDYTGIRDCISAALPSGAPPLQSGLVIGAGGSARAAIYALYSLGVPTVYIYNRTVSKAQDISREFSSRVKVVVIESLDPSSWPAGASSPQVIVGNVPGDAMTESDFPPSLLSSNAGGVIVEMAYKPDVTPLMRAAEKSGGAWKVVRGTDVLLGQGYEQFRLWTGLEPPKEVMIDALTKEVERRKKSE
ncbi:putative pentafunctional AROM polypeptide [Myxozyma melibiosi]|uniref:Pentafunctional AROM polypeptide n=1 Tax=Myxozyma melibiosi TaxID=54550 RepID=A0ABR1FES9_9ASCO